MDERTFLATTRISRRTSPDTSGLLQELHGIHHQSFTHTRCMFGNSIDCVWITITNSIHRTGTIGNRILFDIRSIPFPNEFGGDTKLLEFFYSGKMDTMLWMLFKVLGVGTECIRGAVFCISVYYDYYCVGI